jgi:hypothetical protein
MRKILLFFVTVILLAISFSALSSEVDSTATIDRLEANNAWHVFEVRDIENPVYVTIKQSGNHWEIEGLYDYPPKLSRSQNEELFMATRDFQQWKNAYVDMIIDCDTFEVRESDYQSVCSSRFGEKKAGRAILGTFCGGSGKIAVGYNTGKVAAAIHSIRPEQAQEKLTAFEQLEK